MLKLTGLCALSLVFTWLHGGAVQAAFVSGDIIQIGDLAGIPGGVFHVTEPGDPETSFYTFCAHVGEDLNFDTPYMAVVSDHTDPDNKPVGPLAAWLYTQFLDQSPLLTNFDYSLITASDDNDIARRQAQALQLGIWIGMGFPEDRIIDESAWAGWTEGLVAELKSAYLNQWLTNFAQSGWGQTGFTGQIKILNLYGMNMSGEYTRNVQDLLYRVPEPTTALLLVGSAVAGLALVGRRRRLKQAA